MEAGSNADSLWIGVDALDGGSIPSLNVFRKRGKTFDLVKIISGDEAIRIYKLLTEGDEGLETKM